MTTTAIDTPASPPAQRRHEDTAFLGMVIFLASWAVLFASLFFAYGVVRAGAHAWPPADLPRLPRAQPAFATVVIALSSWSLHSGLGWLKRQRRGAALLVLAAAGLGLLFLLLQIDVWRDLFAAGLRPDTGTYASVFYGLTVFHALHVLVGLAALAWLATGIGVGAPRPGRAIALRLWTLYWHMVAVIWAFLFVLVYLV